MSSRKRLGITSGGHSCSPRFRSYQVQGWSSISLAAGSHWALPVHFHMDARTPQKSDPTLNSRCQLPERLRHSMIP